MAHPSAHQKIRPVKVSQVEQTYPRHRIWQDLISTQRQKIRDIQQQIDFLQQELQSLTFTEEAQRVALEDKQVTLQWSLKDQKERLDRLIRQQMLEKQNDCCHSSHPIDDINS